MSGMTGAGGATETLLAMIELFADPKAAKARVVELQEAAKKAEATIADAAARERNAHSSEHAARVQRDELTAAIAVHNADVARFVAQRDQTNAELTARQGLIKQRETELDAAQKTLTAEFADKAKQLQDRGDAVARRETDAATRDADLQRRQEQLERRERALQRAFAET